MMAPSPNLSVGDATLLGIPFLWGSIGMGDFDSEPATRLMWAKSVRCDGERGLHHPLVCHALDVGEVARAMWHQVVAPAARVEYAGALGLSEAEAGRWIAFWAAAHDIGKASPWFQGRDPGARTVLKTLGFDFPPAGTAPRHDLVTARVLGDWAQQGSCLRLPAVVASRVSKAVGAHHGAYPLTYRLQRLGPSVLGGGRWGRARTHLLDALAEHFGAGSLPTAACGEEPDHAFFVFLAGLVCVADWIGSNDRHFPFAGARVDLAVYTASASDRAANALEALGWKGLSACGNPLDFCHTFGFPPRPLQEAAARLVRGLEGPALVLIEAPMGEGKTEAALALADHWTRATGQRGAYLALPTQATSNQMLARTAQFLNRRYPQDRVNLQLLHGQAALSAEFQAMRLSSVADDDATGTGTVVAEEWFTQGKRGLLAPFAVGTVDQALLSVLQTRHYFVRLFGLAHKTVVLDEVHAYDTYMSTLMERLLEWLGRLGTSVVLLSATLPRSRRRSLLAAYAGTDARSLGMPEAAYPRVTVANSVRAMASTVGSAVCKEAQLRRVPNDRLVGELGGALRDGGCAAVVCNTVGQAQRTYLALRDALRPIAAEVMLFHARFPFGQRGEVERTVLARFGKPGCRPRKAVLVATQVVEQSLDLDFDLMVTEVAPVDLVLQRMGRLHRHERQDRPARLAAPEFWLLEPDLDGAGIPCFGATERVYDRHLLLRSWLSLESKDLVRVPEDVEALVESVYADELPGAPSKRWGAALRESAEARDRDNEECEQSAANVLVGSPALPDDPLEAFNRELEEDSPDVHRSLQAKTRLGPPAVDVVCAFRLTDGVLALDGSGTIPVDLIREPEPGQVERLLQASVSISHRAFFGHFSREAVPIGWQKSPWLRHHKVAEFDAECRMRIDGWALHLDSELGVVIERMD